MEKIIIILSVLMGGSLARNACHEIPESGISSSDQLAIVNKHNALRNLVNEGKVPGQPKAKGIPNLSWDVILAQSAQDITNTCIFEHVSVNDNRFYNIGQNMYLGSEVERGGKWDTYIDAWFINYKNFTYPGPLDVAAHYTQIVSQDVLFVGCGYTMYTTNESARHLKMFVCHYGPGQNIRGVPPYEI